MNRIPLIKRAAAMVLFMLTAAGLSFGAPLDTERLKEATVRIVSIEKIPGDFNIGRGSGFLVDGLGHVVTNFHVSNSVTSRGGILLVIHTKGGKQRMYTAEILRESTTKDLALLKSPITGSAFLSINDATIAEGSALTAIGFPAVSDDRTKEGEFYRFLFDQVGKHGAELKKDGIDITNQVSKDSTLSTWFKHSIIKGDARRYAPHDIQNVVDSRAYPANRPGVELCQCLEYDGNTSGGNSGGPIVDAKGNVVAVVDNTQFTPPPDGKGNPVQTLLKVGIASKEVVSFLDGSSAKATILSDAKPDEVSTDKLVAISIAGAFALLAVGLGIYVAVNRRKAVPVAGPGVTTIIHRLRDQGLLNGNGNGNGNGGAGVAALPPPPPPSNYEDHNGDGGTFRAPGPQIVWELKIKGPAGFHQTLRMTDREFRLGRGRVVVGRSGEFSQLAVNHDSVSRQHFHIEHRRGSLLLADRNSSNGTKVNEQPLTEPFKEQPLREGDVIQFGDLSGTIRRSF